MLARLKSANEYSIIIQRIDRVASEFDEMITGVNII